MENGPFIDDFPIKTSIYKGFSMAMLNNQTVYHQPLIILWLYEDAPLLEASQGDMHEPFQKMFIRRTYNKWFTKHIY